MLKSYRVGGVVVAYESLVSAQGPLVLGFWVWGLRVLGQGLTIHIYLFSISIFVQLRATKYINSTRNQ